MGRCRGFGGSAVEPRGEALMSLMCSATLPEASGGPGHRSVVQGKARGASSVSKEQSPVTGFLEGRENAASAVAGSSWMTK